MTARPSKKTYYDCIPATSVHRQRRQIFTYHVDSNDAALSTLSRGDIVMVPFRKSSVAAVIIGNHTGTVDFATKVIEQRAPLNTLPEHTLRMIEWIAHYYATPETLVAKTVLPRMSKRFLKSGATQKKGKVVARDNTEQHEQPQKPTAEQQHAIATINAATTPVLLHGPTGSGKTEVYLQAIQHQLDNNKQAIVLVPEIALTPQAYKRYTNRFGENAISMFHSQQTPTTRFANWHRFVTGSARILIGPRSAILVPSHNLGLIIIDEEHEHTYKQWDQHPRYDARTVAEWRAKHESAALVLGSATPRVESIYRANNKSPSIARAVLKRRISGTAMPIIKVVDMRLELRAKNFSPHSFALQEAISNTLKHKKQVVLFHSRRGTASCVLCRECGHVETCHNCELPFTYHQRVRNQTNILLCHHCGTTKNTPVTCSSCNSPAIKFLGSGTEKVEQETRALFPSARIQRLDSDTASSKGAHQTIYEDFTKGAIDILIGTQMITKGWDIPSVYLVGIMAADTMLFLPDFRSEERAFQLLTQVAGRTGRGDDQGSVILQTYNPDNSVIQAVADYNQTAFYSNELAQRKPSNFPPFSKCIAITIAHTNEQRAEQLAHASRTTLEKNRHDTLTILGPTPSFYARRNNKYQWSLLIIAPTTLSQQEQQQLLQNLPEEASIDVDPSSLLQ